MNDNDLPLEPRQFAIMGVRPDLLAGLRDLGFETPTPVQEQVIPALLRGRRDMFGLAQTGTGKTAAFGVPLIQLADPESEVVQGLVLCPTRELCVQVCKDIRALARHVRGLRCVAVYGGSSIGDQIRSLKSGAQIVVATPGRLLDLLKRKAVNLRELQTLVLDEAEEMLNMGFREAIDDVVPQTPDTKQTLLFSATMSREVKAIASNYMTDPLSITVGTANAAAENVSHEYYVVHSSDRYLALKRLADVFPQIYCIIFCRTRVETQEVADKLIQDGYDAEALHGEMPQSQRTIVMDKFRRRNLQMLVATDVAARGLDVNDLSHVINYNLPDDNSVYTHRAGRTGRAGKTGCSVTIVHMRERHRIVDLERRLKVKFEHKPVPTGREICKRQLLNLIDHVQRVTVDHDQIDPFWESLSEKLVDLDRETLIKRFASVQLNRFLDYYKNAPDLNVPPPAHRKDRHGSRDERNNKDRKGGYRGRSSGFSCLHLNVGKDDGITPLRIIGTINRGTGNRDIRIGRISVQGRKTIFETDSRFIKEVSAVFEGSNINGKRVKVRPGLSPDRDGGPPQRRRNHEMRPAAKANSKGGPFRKNQQNKKRSSGRKAKGARA